MTRKEIRAKIRALVPAMSLSMLVFSWLSGGSAWAADGTAPALLARGPETLAMANKPTRPLPVTTTVVPAAPDLGLLPGQSLHALFQTTIGNIDCALAVEAAPVTVAAFVALAQGHRAWVDPRSGEPTFRPLYNGTIFHRTIPDFLIQGGDPTGTGTGGPGFNVPDENLAGSVFDQAGALGLASRGANTGGSQFFITAGPARHLDGRFTRFGTCEDVGVISKIATVARGERNRPVRDVVLRTVQVVAR